MENQLIYFINVFIKFFFLLTPFFALSAFLSMTAEKNARQRQKLAVRTALSVCAIVLIIFFFGNYIFLLAGITINSFRIGAGALLFLTSVSLVRGTMSEKPASKEDDIVVVPLSIPIIAGPGTIGAILVLSSDVSVVGQKLLSLAAIFAAILGVGIILLLSAKIERALGRKGIVILSKLTGLILAALSAEMIFTGVREFLK